MKARGTVTAFAALVAAAISGAQAADETVRLTGRCVDESGTPIADVVVSVRQQAEANNASRSAADGSFIIDVPRRSFDGVLLTASDEKGDRLAAVVHPDRGRGDEKQDLRIVLRKAHKLDVTVTDAQGELVTGARVAAVYRQQTMAEQMTDEGGRAVLRVPADAEHLVYAVKRGVGLDYMRLKPDGYEQLKLTLRESVPIRVTVLDQMDRPIAGAKVYPLQISRLNEPLGSFHLWELKELHETTDAAGVATCRVPIDNVAPVPFQVEAEGYARSPRVYWMPDESITGIRTGTRITGARMAWENEFSIKLKSAVVVRGIVVHADGRPAAGARAGALGYGYDKAQYVQGVTCDEAGRFTISLQSDLYYVFTSQSETEKAPYQTRVVRADRPVEPIKLVLQPARRLYGTLTGGAEKKPLAQQYLQIYWRDEQSHSKLPPEDRLPNPSNDPTPIVLGIFNHVRTDDQGRFEFPVPPGKYYIGMQNSINAILASGDLSALVQADVTDQPETRADMHIDSPE